MTAVKHDTESGAVLSGNWRPFLYGGLASCVAEISTFPADTAKTHLQLQGQHFDKKHAKLKYKGMIDVIVQIYKREGLARVYCGLSPALLRQSTYGTIKFGTYYNLKKFLDNETKENSLINLCCAVTAGAMSSAIANPTDLMKVRMQVQGRSMTRQNVFRNFHDVYSNEGVRGLWRGVGPTSQRAAMITGVELPAYDFLKNLFFPYLGNTIHNHFASSLLASFVGALATNPIDVIRSRMMSQRRLLKTQNTSEYIYKSSFDCIIRTVKTEGALAFYKGFVPNFFRLGPWNIIFFVTYEQMKIWY